MRSTAGIDVVGLGALTHRDDGTTEEPRSAAEWERWVAAGRTKNFLEEDPVLDWLDRYGRAHGFVPDNEMVGFDARTDFLAFTVTQGESFEDRVVQLLRDMVPVVRITSAPAESQDIAKAYETFDAMRDGHPVIHQGLLRDPETMAYGSPDLLVRSDVLERLIPGALLAGESAYSAPALSGNPWHYRVVEVKFTTLHLLRDGHAASDHAAHMGQAWLYNAALGRLQGWIPPSAFLLGRGWRSAVGRGSSCFDRLARVDHNCVVRAPDNTLAQQVMAAVRWIQRLREQGASWSLVPVPSVPELYPHARHNDDQPWHGAKASLAHTLAELTLLPGMNPERRRAAHAKGIRRWDHPRLKAAKLDVPEQYAEKCDAVIIANSSRGDAVVPRTIINVDPIWRDIADLEVFVDFETVSNLADDFTRLPAAGGQPLIFQIGCGWYEGSSWRFWQATTDRLDESYERQVIDDWIELMLGLTGARHTGWSGLRVFHWSNAEVSSLEGAYTAARLRHPERDWPDIPWFDVLDEVVRAEPVAVRGAFGFGLKAVAKAMKNAGLIDTTWADGPADGLGAMVGAWWCDADAARMSTTMPLMSLMTDIGRYNEVDCRAMAEVLEWLRRNR